LANPDNAVVYQNNSVVIPVISNDTDDGFGGASLIVTSIVQEPVNGTAIIDVGGETITYTPNVGFFGSDSFNYEITDIVGLTSTSSVSINVYEKVIFTLSASQSAVEGDVKTFTVTKSGSNIVNESVSFRTLLTGSAEVADFTALDTTITFTPTDTTKSVSVTIGNDGVWEYDDVVDMELYNPSVNAALGAASSSQITITDDADTPTFTPSGAVADEAIAVVEVPFTLSNQSERTITMFWTRTHETTTEGDLCWWNIDLSEYLCIGESPRQIDLAPMVTGGSIFVGIQDDGIFEGAETFNVLFTSGDIAVEAGVNPRVTVTILDSIVGPSFTINNVSASEGNVATFAITKSGSTSLTHNVNYATATGTAGTGDYTTKSGTLSFPAGTTSLTVVVSTTEDGVYEGSEVFYLNLSSSTNGAIIADSQGSATITNDDVAPSFTINNVSASEGNTATFTITKSGSTSLTHNVNCVTATGTAGTSDYTTKSGTLSFPAGTTSKTVSVLTTEESIYEASEVFYLNLSSATSGATIADSQGSATITNDDAGPSFTINNVSVSEGNVATFTITKSSSTAFTHNVNYATASGSAGSGDYTAKSGTLSFPAGTTSKTVAVATTEESTYEGSEMFYMNLSAATSGATIADSQGSATITNDDVAPSFRINNASAWEGNNLTFTVTKIGSTALTHNVSYVTANVTAVAGSDYVAKSGTLSLTSGQTSKTIIITGVEDSVCAENSSELFYLNLSSSTNGATIGDSRGNGSVLDDDNCIPVAVDDSDSASNASYDRFFPVLMNDSDGDGHTLTVTNAVKTSGPGFISYSSTAVNFVSLTCGTSVVQYTISDGNGGTDTANFTISVTGCSTGGGGGGGPPPF
jgi:hypothetical protein